MVSLLVQAPQKRPLFTVIHPPSLSSSLSNNISLPLSTESDKLSSHTESSSSHSVIHSGRWSHTENSIFLSSVAKFGNNWKKIQENIKTRTTTQARSHAQKIFIKIKNKNIIDINNSISTIQELFAFLKSNHNSNFSDIYNRIVLLANEDTKGGRSKKDHSKREKNKKKASPFLVIHNPPIKEHNDNISNDINPTFNSTSPYKKEEEDFFDELLIPKDFLNKKSPSLLDDDFDLVFSNL